jgi:MFS family permease
MVGLIDQRQIHFINFCRKLTVNSILFLIPIHFLKLGFTGWQIGFVTAFYAISPLVFSFPAGWINDHLSIMKMIRGALLLVSSSLFLIGRTNNFLLLAGVFLIMGISNNALDVSTNSLFYKDERQMDQNKKYGQLSFWLAMGMAVGTFAGGFLTQYASFKIMFSIYSGFMFLILFFTGNIGPEQFDRVTLKEYRLELVNRKTLLFMIMIFVLTLHWGAENTVYSPFLKDFFQLNNLQVSLYISIPLFFLALSAFLISLRKYNPRVNKRLFLFSLTISGLGLILMVNKSLPISFVFRVVHEIGDGLMGALIVLYISRLFQKRSIGGSSGILLAVMTTGHMVGSFLFSTIGFRYGLHLPFIISGFLLLANALYSVWVFRKEDYG